jgi:hypothetical protein
MQGFDWRNRENYSYMDHLAKRDWSWECVRRNGKFEADWSSAEPGFETSAQFGSLTVIEARDADTALDRWSLLFCDAPHLDAGRQRYSGALIITKGCCR